MITRFDLDVRICDMETNTNNTETYREFIRSSEKEFGLEEKDIDSLEPWNLNKYLDFLDDLWSK